MKNKIMFLYKIAVFSICMDREKKMLDARKGTSTTRLAVYACGCVLATLLVATFVLSVYDVWRLHELEESGGLKTKSGNAVAKGGGVHKSSASKSKVAGEAGSVIAVSPELAEADAALLAIKGPCPLRHCPLGSDLRCSPDTCDVDSKKCKKTGQLCSTSSDCCYCIDAAKKLALCRPNACPAKECLQDPKARCHQDLCVQGHCESTHKSCEKHSDCCFCSVVTAAGIPLKGVCHPKKPCPEKQCYSVATPQTPLDLPCFYDACRPVPGTTEQRCLKTGVPCKTPDDCCACELPDNIFGACKPKGLPPPPTEPPVPTAAPTEKTQPTEAPIRSEAPTAPPVAQSECTATKCPILGVSLSCLPATCLNGQCNNAPLGTTWTCTSSIQCCACSAADGVAVQCV